MGSADEKDRSRERSRRGERSSRFSENSRDRSADRGRSDRGGSKGNRVFVSNIPYEFRWQDLKDLFKNEVGDVQFAELFLDSNDKSRGCGIVEFANHAAVKKCVDIMHNFDVKGRRLVVKEDGVGDKGMGGNKRPRHEEPRFNHREERYDSHSSLVGRNNQSADVDDNKWGNTYGLSPNFLNSLRIDVPLCNRVFVANLEYNVDKKKIKEVFRLAGKIQRVDLQLDKEGRSRGFAVVEYDHPVEAVQAISMFNNQFLYDRQMTVRMDRVIEVTKLPDGLKAVGMGLGTNGEPLKDVARNLPSNNQQSTVATPSMGAGILGGVPNSTLQAAAALSSLNNIGGGAFGNLGNASVLQAANLAGVSSLGVNNLLNSSLGNSDLNFASNALNPLVQNQSQQFAALAASNNSNNMQSLSSNFSRNNSSNNMPSNFNSSNNFDNKPNNFRYGNENNFSNLSNNPIMHSSSSPASKTSRKVIVSNLPASASFKMLHEKFSEFGEIQHFEEKGTGTMLVAYHADWQADRAIKNLDRARIDGRTIDARYYF